jgi:hypothetical protein
MNSSHISVRVSLRTGGGHSNIGIDDRVIRHMEATTKKLLQSAHYSGFFKGIIAEGGGPNMDPKKIRVVRPAPPASVLLLVGTAKVYLNYSRSKSEDLESFCRRLIAANGQDLHQVEDVPPAVTEVTFEEEDISDVFDFEAFLTGFAKKDRFGSIFDEDPRSLLLPVYFHTPRDKDGWFSVYSFLEWVEGDIPFGPIEETLVVMRMQGYLEGRTGLIPVDREISPAGAVVGCQYRFTEKGERVIRSQYEKVVDNVQDEVLLLRIMEEEHEQRCAELQNLGTAIGGVQEEVSAIELTVQETAQSLEVCRDRLAALERELEAERARRRDLDLSLNQRRADLKRSRDRLRGMERQRESLSQQVNNPDVLAELERLKVLAPIADGKML